MDVFGPRFLYSPDTLVIHGSNFAPAPLLNDTYALLWIIIIFLIFITHWGLGNAPPLAMQLFLHD